MKYCLGYFLMFLPFVVLAQNINWQTTPNDYEHSMSLTCVVLNQEGNMTADSVIVGVFDSDVCVGVGVTDTYYSPLNANLGFVVVYGDFFEDSYSLKVQIGTELYEAGDLSFSANAILGNIVDPFVISPIYSGCTDSLALNYNVDAIEDDGACIWPVYGCMDVNAYNYLSIANIDDGSCEPIVFGCHDSNFIEYNANANSGNQEVYCLTEKVYGCTNDCYEEYNPIANVDDESCEITWREAYLNLLNEVDNSVSMVLIDMIEGWNLIGFTLVEEKNAEESLDCIIDRVFIVKDNVGQVFIPQYNFNGIGNLIPGLGYQIKLSEAISDFNYCE